MAIAKKKAAPKTKAVVKKPKAAPVATKKAAVKAAGAGTGGTPPAPKTIGKATGTGGGKAKKK